MMTEWVGVDFSALGWEWHVGAVLLGQMAFGVFEHEIAKSLCRRG
jgi:hypothetical protein